jgi:phenylalanyl-tRNA synthetase alpha chain
VDWEGVYLPEARDAIVGAARAGDRDGLEAARVRYLGRKSPLTAALRTAATLPVEERAALNRTKLGLESLVKEARLELDRVRIEHVLAAEAVDVTLPGEQPARGHLHLITQMRREVESVFLGLGYEVVDGREVENTHYNFDGLAFPFWHPARSPHNSLFLTDDVLLRTETSPSQIRVMERRRPPVYMISHGRVYRRDTIDATHYPIFHQVEGLAVDRGITLADLKGTLLHLMRALFGEERELRFRTHYFPFTEPSMEPDVSCFLCDGAGCRTCKFSGWIEMGGSGLVDPAVLEFVGYDPEEYSGFAFGLGLERMAQLRHGVPDTRLLWQSDLRVLSQF